MKKSKLILSSMVLALSVTSVQTYTIEYSTGFDPTPTRLYCYEGFGDATIEAIEDACAEWNSTEAGIMPIAYEVEMTKEEILENNRMLFGE